MEQIRLSQKHIINQNRREMAEAREKLDELQKIINENKRKEKGKKLFVHPIRPHDEEGFQKRTEMFNNRRKMTIERIEKERTNEINQFFKPQLNENTLELTKNRPRFNQTIDLIIEKSKSQAPNKQKNNKILDLSVNKKDDPRDIPNILKEQALKIENSKIYEKNIEWKKEKDDRVFEQQISKNLITEKLPNFNPSLNTQKNNRIVQETFENRSENHKVRVNEKIQKLYGQLYELTFKPKTLKRKVK